MSKAGAIPQPLLDARLVLLRHPALKNVTDVKALKDGSHVIDVEAQVPLPTRARRKGQTASGIRGIEPVRFKFPPEYPYKAPVPTLRAGFPSNLPHINPHAANERVPPCISEANLDELLHRFGFEELVDQTLDWLSDAAKGQLVKEHHGWEPTRRDDLDGLVRFDAQEVLSRIPASGALRAAADLAADKDFALFKLDLAKTNQAPPFSAKRNKGQRFSFGDTTVFFAAAAAVDGQLPVFGEYRPDTVVDGPSLLTRAREFGVDAGRLEADVKEWLASCWPNPKAPWPWDDGLCFAVVLVARRPFKLVSDDRRDVEFIPYVLRLSKAERPELKLATVRGAQHFRTLSPDLLARVSGFADVDSQQGFLLLGCGSVGSKIGAHLGRAGFGNAVFLDSEHLEPHNTARHAASLGEDFWPEKAKKMADLFRSFGHKAARPVHQDAVPLPTGPADAFAGVLPANCKLIIDSTASLRVGTAAIVSPHLKGPRAGRYCRTMLYGQGRVAVVLLEGRDRSPRCDDLMAQLFQACRGRDDLRSALGSGSTEASRVFIGDNCASFTMPMSDSTVSRASAMMAMQVERWLVDGIPEHGGLYVGLAQSIGMQWDTIEVPPPVVLEPSGLGTWQVRVASHLVTQMRADAQKWAPLETGGALLGHVDDFTKTITLAALVDAPPDSQRSESEFKLGIEGLETNLRSTWVDSIGYLRYVGTWHSHPMGGKHSGTDKNTLRRLAVFAAGAPMLSLVLAPEGLHCAVASA